MTLISLSFSLSKLFLILNQFLSFKISTTGGGLCHFVEMEQNLERDQSIQENLSEIVHKETTHKCNQCKFATARGSSLRRHLKMHIGEKRNKCNQCDYASTDAGTLRRHLKTHSGEKKNKCNQCDYASSRADSLRTHLKRHN